MKKFFTIVLFSTFAVAAVAQKTGKKPKRHYINLAYATQTLDFGSAASKLTSDHAAAVEFGSTFFMHRKPIADMVRIGLDFSYLDAQYASFRFDGWDEEGYPAKLDAHFANLGMQVGPSVTVTPLDWLNARAYVHYAPSVVGFSPESFDNIKFGYAGYITGGVQVSLKFVTLGVELRNATSKMNTIVIDEEDIEDGSLYDKGPKVRTKLPNTRFILGFRF